MDVYLFFLFGGGSVGRVKIISRNDWYFMMCIFIFGIVFIVVSRISLRN